MAETWIAHDTAAVSDSGGYTALDSFFCSYLLHRDASRALSLLSPQVCGIGIGTGEAIVGKGAFSDLLRDQMRSLPDAISYTISNYWERERVPGCWDCLCDLEIRISFPEGTQSLYHLRLTAGFHQEGDACLIDVLHASETAQFQEVGELVPFRFVSQSGEVLGWETRHQLMNIIGQIMPGGIVGCYLEDGFPLYVANERLLKMTGYASYEEFESDVHGLLILSVHPEDRNYVNSEMSRIIALGDQYELEYRMRKRDGGYLWVHMVGRRTGIPGGRNVIIGAIMDISQQVHVKNRLLTESETDPLTGIYNRRAAQERIANALHSSFNYLLFVLDLDNFKQLNDLYGHAQGDRALRLFAHQLMGAFRKTDTVFRLGGDEFGVFLADCEDVFAIEQKIRTLIDSYQIMVHSLWPSARSSLSVGGVYGQRSRTFEELYQMADEMLYAVKRTQKGRLKLRILE